MPRGLSIATKDQTPPVEGVQSHVALSLEHGDTVSGVDARLRAILQVSLSGPLREIHDRRRYRPKMPTDDAAHATAVAQELLGQSLDQLCVGAGDAQLRFTHSTVSLWSTIRVSTGDDALVRPNTLDGVALLMPLLNGEVTAVDIDSSGRLSFTLGGVTVWCESDPDYEAWSYDGRQGEKVVCTPGGDLAIWDADR